MKLSSIRDGESKSPKPSNNKSKWTENGSDLTRDQWKKLIYKMKMQIKRQQKAKMKEKARVCELRVEDNSVLNDNTNITAKPNARIVCYEIRITQYQKTNCVPAIVLQHLNFVRKSMTIGAQTLLWLLY